MEVVGKYRGYDTASHGGDIDGFSSEVFLLPSKRLGIVILANSSTDGKSAVTALRNCIVDHILGVKNGNWIEKAELLQSKNKERVQKALSEFTETVSHQNSCALEQYVGIYEHPSYGTVEIVARDGQAVLLYSDMAIPLIYKTEEQFAGQLRGLLIYGINPNCLFSFFKDSDGSVCRLEIPFEGFRGAKPVSFLRKLD